VTLPGTSSLHVNQGTLQFDVAAGILTLAQALHCSDTLAKSGAGELIIAGSQDYASGAVFDVVGGTVVFDTDAGSPSSATLTLDVTGAEVDFGWDQHLDTLKIGPGGKVVLTGAHVVVVNHLVFDGLDFGAMALMPEPATIGLLAAGLVACLARRRRTPNRP